MQQPAEAATTRPQGAITNTCSLPHCLDLRREPEPVEDLLLRNEEPRDQDPNQNQNQKPGSAASLDRRNLEVEKRHQEAARAAASAVEAAVVPEKKSEHIYLFSVCS